MIINLNNPSEITIDNVRRLIASGDPSKHAQIRVKKNGELYLSLIVGGDDTNDLAFRLETFSAHSDNVGKDAAKCKKWVQRIYNAITKNWPIPTDEYIELF
ncbi:MAG: hypothetical protein JKX76_03160 [Colwellia sp.]|nr:hypothetical protein [Colwellia sp.]